MKNKNNKPLQVALYGMEERAYKTMSMYLKGPCKGVAIVVDEFAADVDLIDADHIKAKDLLEGRKAKSPSRPIIVLSLEEILLPDTIYVKKPVTTADLVAAFKQAAIMLNTAAKAKKVKGDREQQAPIKPDLNAIKNLDNSSPKSKKTESKRIDEEERKKTSKHRTAMDLTEVGFSNYLGNLDGINFSDSQQVLNASFNPKDFFLGYVQSALKAAKAKGRIAQLNSGWKPLIIFPYSKEIWLDADDKQLRAFAGLVIKKNENKGMSLTPVDQAAANCSKKMEGFYDVDNFLWKLAVWTSKGRYPDTIDIDSRVFLTHWPNFTRLVVTPHAMRIAALLVMGPRTAMSIASDLNIKPQYVFVFISAAHALGLVGQTKRQADEIIASPEVNRSKSKGLLGRILGRLRG